MPVTESIIITVAGLSALTVVALLTKRKRASQRLLRQEIGLSWLQSLRVFLSDVQKHRGLTNGYLNGAEAFKADIEPLQHKVGRDISDIIRIDPWMDGNERWQAITQHWARLAGRYVDNTAENNLNQHNALIQNILYLIDDMAQEHELLLLRGRSGKPLHLAWRELLSAAEYVGQARAAGMGVAAAASCGSVERIRLKYLSQQIEENVARVWKEIPTSSADEELVNSFVHCINNEMIVSRPNIDPNEYFRIATEALDCLHGQYDKVVEELKWKALG